MSFNNQMQLITIGEGYAKVPVCSNDILIGTDRGHTVHRMLTNNSISTAQAGVRIFSCIIVVPKPSIKNIYKTD